jgi:hypothetical protein
MRWFLTLLMVLAVASGLIAQDRRATVEMDDGTVYTGKVLQEDVRQVVLDVDGHTQVLNAARIKSFEVEPAKTDGQKGGSGTAAGDDGGASGIHRYLFLMPRLKLIEQRFPWLRPTAPMQWMSIAVMLFVFAAFSLHIATRVVGAEAAFRQSAFLAIWVCIATIAQVAFVPMNGAALLAMVLGNGLALIIMLRLMFGLSFPAACMAIVVLLIETAVGYGIVELIDATLLSIGNFGGV